MSSIIDYTDRTTCIIFGDGAGAVLFEPNTEGLGLIDEILRSDGAGRQSLKIDAGGSILPASKETVENKQHYVFQDGKTVFKFAVTNMADVSEEVMKRNNLSGEDIQWLVPHQANKRIIDATSRRMDLPEDKVMINIHKYGNTTSATLPMCIWDYENQLKKGDNLVFASFGGGFTWGAIYLKWAYDPK
ncbi:MAG: 3-oxoacyl-[acyl-carrier-protein] synthase-3 [Patiriisocius sp.]|jgi:3-oxoacyl-[acyl-carrier-protein] synthase-3